MSPHMLLTTVLGKMTSSSGSVVDSAKSRIKNLGNVVESRQCRAYGELHPGPLEGVLGQKDMVKSVIGKGGVVESTNPGINNLDNGGREHTVQDALANFDPGTLRGCQDRNIEI